MVAHVVPHPVLLSNSRPVVGGTRRERHVRIGEHVTKETEPWPDVVRTVLPAGGRGGESVVIGITPFVDDTLEGDITPNAIAGLGEQTRAEQAREPPVAIDEGVDSEEIEREQSDKKHAVVATGPLLDAVPIDKFGHEKGRVLVRGRDETDTRRSVHVSVHDEIVDGLELPSSTTGSTKEEPMEMKDETNGEITRVLLEQVVEGIAVPGQLPLIADAEPLVGAADDAFSSGLLDDDPL